ncbi:hypothetical protein ABZ926_25935, partial [Streptomyces litmocidini]
MSVSARAVLGEVRRGQDRVGFADRPADGEPGSGAVAPRTKSRTTPSPRRRGGALRAPAMDAPPPGGAPAHPVAGCARGAVPAPAPPLWASPRWAVHPPTPVVGSRSAGAERVGT